MVALFEQADYPCLEFRFVNLPGCEPIIDDIRESLDAFFREVFEKLLFHQTGSWLPAALMAGWDWHLLGPSVETPGESSGYRQCESSGEDEDDGKGKGKKGGKGKHDDLGKGKHEDLGKGKGAFGTSKGKDEQEGW